MRRKLLRTLLIAVLLGAATNVLVTAWFVYDGMIGQNHQIVIWDRGDCAFRLVILPGAGKSICSWESVGPLSRDARDFAGSGAQEPVPFIDHPPAWSTVVRAPSTPLTPGAPQRSDFAYGWPCLSFRGGMVTLMGAPTQPVLDYGPALPELVRTFTLDGSTITHREPRVVPLHPIVPGLLANTAVYGAAWWLILFAPGVIRRWRRRRRGACVACGYDRRGIGAAAACPECGASAGEAGANDTSGVAVGAAS